LALIAQVVVNPTTCAKTRVETGTSFVGKEKILYVQNVSNRVIIVNNIFWSATLVFSIINKTKKKIKYYEWSISYKRVHQKFHELLKTRGRSKYYQGGRGLFFVWFFFKEKNRISKQFVLRKIKRYQGVIQNRHYKRLYNRTKLEIFS
jgi:hypothetical protein